MPKFSSFKKNNILSRIHYFHVKNTNTFIHFTLNLSENMQED